MFIKYIIPSKKSEILANKTLKMFDKAQKKRVEKILLKEFTKIKTRYK